MVSKLNCAVCPTLVSALLLGFCQVSLAQDYMLAAPGSEPQVASGSKGATLFQNVRIFDGKSAALSAPSNVLVKGNIIERISLTPIAVDANADVRVIAAGGRVLMPGLIDAHWHSFMAATAMPLLTTADPSYLHILATRQAEATLMRGFTTVRDLGGPVFGLKRAIDEGAIKGPRIYPSGAMISQTSGHGDFRFPFEVPRTPGGPLSQSETKGAAAIADSPDEVRLRAREQLRLGASQIKLMGGGGVSSQYNPIESTQFTEAEIRAAVEAAENWGTYVAIHAYTPRAIRQAVAAGVRCIEHGQLIDEPTVKLLAEKGIWWSLQPLTYDADVFARMTPVSQKKGIGSVRRHGERLQAGEEVQRQDSLRHRHSVQCGGRYAAGRVPRPDGPLVHTCRSTQDGHCGQWRADGTVRIYQPLSRQTWCCGGRCSCRSAAGRGQSFGEHSTRRRPRQELSGHHEGRHDLQEHITSLKVCANTIAHSDRMGSRDVRYWPKADMPLAPTSV
jgi:imidazolonepropionase-like amidohydrolase